jgi:ferredoxin
MKVELTIIPENVPGNNYVLDSCIDCDTCRCIAPGLFARSQVNGYSYVRRQPVTELDEELMEEAIECCPVSAIRDRRSDGDGP